ncbi:MAG: hypothetical protein V4505_25675 [Pseudomonadota bacterium]
MGGEIYRVPDDVHLELLNWSRWCWTGDWPHPGMVMFAEDDDEVRPAAPNERHARIVQAAWERMHTSARLVLRAEYPQRTGKGRAFEASKLQMTALEYETALRWGVLRIEEAFDAVCA